MQATSPCPIGNASSFYYISKINIYNLTFASSNDAVSCYVWHEGEGIRGTNEIGSCVWNYLNDVNKKAVEDGKTIDVIFYTDNCSGQNKNRFLFALYLFAVSKLTNIGIITHKYLIRGHTQNDVDNVYSVIGRQITSYKKAIYVPDQYITLIRQAKKTKQLYIVHELTHSDFLDLKGLASNMIMKQSYKSSNRETVEISDIKVYEVRKNSPTNFFCKLSFSKNEFLSVSMFARRTSVNLKNWRF